MSVSLNARSLGMTTADEFQIFLSVSVTRAPLRTSIMTPSRRTVPG